MESDVSLKTIVEALLFVAEAPAAPEELAKAAGAPPSAVASVIRELAEEYGNGKRGFIVQEHKGKYQLVTAPEVAEYVARFLGLDLTTRLSNAALEVLSVVAYRQPVTRAQIESVRGVNSDAALNTLIQRGLVEEVGVLQAPGRPRLYGTTSEFLRIFGLRSLDDLPPLNVEVEAPTIESGIRKLAPEQKSLFDGESSP